MMDEHEYNLAATLTRVQQMIHTFSEIVGAHPRDIITREELKEFGAILRRWHTALGAAVDDAMDPMACESADE
jgi:hypothetical protein